MLIQKCYCLDLCKTRYNTIIQELETDGTQQSQHCVWNWAGYLRTEYIYTEKSMIRFSLILVWLGSNYFLLLSTTIMVKQAPTPNTRICKYIGTHTSYVKTIWKRTKDIEKYLLIFLNPIYFQTLRVLSNYIQRWILSTTNPIYHPNCCSII